MRGIGATTLPRAPYLTLHTVFFVLASKKSGFSINVLYITEEP